MKAELLEKLLDAGFSKDEIIQLARDEPAAAAQVPEAQPEPAEPEQEAAAEAEQEAELEKASDTEHVSSETEKRIAGIEKSIADLLKAVQVGNLKTDSIQTPIESAESLADNSIVQIIRPARHERGVV